MNDKQKIEDLFHNEAHVLAMTAKATRCLSMRRGRTATYAESMEEFGYAFRGFALGIDLPDFQVRRSLQSEPLGTTASSEKGSQLLHAFKFVVTLLNLDLGPGEVAVRDRRIR